MTKRRRPGEHGMIAVWFAVILLMVVAMTAVVIDLGALRAQHRGDRAAADFAATAGAAALASSGTENAADACERAWEVFLDNAGNATPIVSEPDCTTFVDPCDPSSPSARSTTGVAGRYVVTITHPVLDSDDLMQGTSGPAQAIDPEVDGEPCERLGVRVERDRSYSFARVLGFETGSTDVHAVARRSTGVMNAEGAALLLLERSACDALLAEGKAEITVRESPPDENGVTSPGYIMVDSDGAACAGDGYTLAVLGNNARIEAEGTGDGRPGEIRLFALEPWATECHQPACDTADVAEGRVSPQPITSSVRLGRTPVDHRYNCKVSYDDLGAPWTGSAAVPSCPGTTATSGPIDVLVDAYQSGGAPSGFDTYPRAGVPDDTCDQPGGADPVTLVGDWYFDCPGGLTVRSGITVTGNAVFEAGIALESNSGILEIGDGDGPRVAYLRQGGITKGGQAGLALEETFVYLHDGGLSIAGGSGTLHWVAPASGDFAALALWSESTQPHSLAGSADLEVRGVFFAPNVGYQSDAFSISGGSASDMVAEAQFITHRLRVHGNAPLSLRPDPTESVPVLPDHQTRLIR